MRKTLTLTLILAAILPLAALLAAHASPAAPRTPQQFMRELREVLGQARDEPQRQIYPYLSATLNDWPARGGVAHSGDRWSWIVDSRESATLIYRPATHGQPAGAELVVIRYTWPALRGR